MPCWKRQLLNLRRKGNCFHIAVESPFKGSAEPARPLNAYSAATPPLEFDAACHC